MATPVSNDITNNQAGENTEAEVHSMPEKFLTTKAPVKNSFGKWLLLGLIVIALIGIGVAVVFWLQSKTVTPPPDQSNNNQPPTSTVSTTLPIVEKTSADRDKERLQAVQQLQLALQRYFLQTTAYPRSLEQLIDNGFINQIPTDPATNQPYLYSAGENSFQINFVLEEGAPWGVTVLTKGKYFANATGILPEEEAKPPVPPITPGGNSGGSDNPQMPVIAQDTDNDGLTDVEETLYHTSSTKTDTDNDGYSDGEELLGGYDPAAKNKRIWESAYASVYRNQVFKYNLTYPKAWSIRVNNEDREVLLTNTSTDEFVEVLVSDNPLGLSSINWYLRENPEANMNLMTTVTVDGMPALQTGDGLVTYLSVGTKLFIISYNVGVNKEAHFLATYKMILKTFQANKAPAVTMPIINNNSTTTTSTQP